jgi:hypothetical protein
MKKYLIFIICILLPLALIPVIIIYNKYQIEQDYKILREGKITTGTIDYKDYRADEGDITYIVGYVFTVNGIVYESEDRYRNDSNQYVKAVIGKKYIVRYLPVDPDDIEDNSRIYLDNPVSD